MAEPALDDDERHAFASHLDRVGVTHLMWSEPSANAGGKRGVSKFGPGGGAGPLAAARWTGEQAEERPDGELDSRVEPWLELGPAPSVHAHLASPSTLAATDQQSAAALIEIGLGEGERLVDAQPGTPEDDDQAAQPKPVRAVAGGAHDGDDLFNFGWIGGVPQTLCCAAADRRGSPAWSLAIGVGPRDRAAAQT